MAPACATDAGLFDRALEAFAFAGCAARDELARAWPPAESAGGVGDADADFAEASLRSSSAILISSSSSWTRLADADFADEFADSSSRRSAFSLLFFASEHDNFGLCFCPHLSHLGI